MTNMTGMVRTIAGSPKIEVKAPVSDLADQGGDLAALKQEIIPLQLNV